MMPSKVGIWRSLPFPLLYQEGGQYWGFDVGIKDRVDELANMQSQMVLLDTLDDRITALQNGTVDWVVGGFSVTPQRAQLVDFVRPYVYSAGAALFAPGGSIPGVGSWQDVGGKNLVALQGYYANDVLTRNYGAVLTLAPDLADGAARVAAGEGIALVDDSTDLRPANNLQLVASIPPLLPLPYAVAVKKGNTALANRISRALYQMATGGASSDLARLEQQYFIANGAPPNPDLAALLANPQSQPAQATDRIG